MSDHQDADLQRRDVLQAVGAAMLYAFIGELPRQPPESDADFLTF